MQILKTVIVKQVLTEQGKEELEKQFLGEKEQLQKECEQFRFEMKKYVKNNKSTDYRKSERLQIEINKRFEKIKILDFQIEQLHILPFGSELKVSEVTAMVNVEVGDKWDDGNETIIIKDGFVHEIRKGGKS